MDFKAAIEKHGAWKIKFRMAITERGTMDASSIAVDNVCDLGKWLHGSESASCRGLGTFPELIAAHRAFHQEAGKIAQAINGKRYAEAETMLNGTSYGSASQRVGAAIMACQRELAKKAA